MEPRITHARKEYEQAALDEATVARDPIAQFAAWYDAAVAAGVPEPEAMTLSTATPDGRPSARIVLLRGFDCIAHVPLGRPGAAGPDRGPRRADNRRRVGRVFPHAAEHVADRGLEFAAE